MGPKKLHAPATSANNNTDDNVTSDRTYHNNRADFPLFVAANRTYLDGAVKGGVKFLETGTCTDPKGRVVVHSARHAQDYADDALAGTIDEPWDRFAHMSIPRPVSCSNSVNLA